jgi:hypothetical protein
LNNKIECLDRVLKPPRFLTENVRGFLYSKLRFLNIFDNIIKKHSRRWKEISHSSRKAGFIRNDRSIFNGYGEEAAIRRLIYSFSIYFCESPLLPPMHQLVNLSFRNEVRNLLHISSNHYKMRHKRYEMMDDLFGNREVYKG